MIRAVTILAIAVSAGACDSRQSTVQKTLADARDVERVEAAQNVPPPVAMLSPQPIGYRDIEENKLHGASCAFLPEGEEGARVAIAMPGAAFVKIDGALRVFAADKGSAPLPLGSWTRYEGREHLLDLQTAGGESTPSGKAPSGLPGRLTIRDPYDRVVYSATGTVQCGA